MNATLHSFASPATALLAALAGTALLSPARAQAEPRGMAASFALGLSVDSGRPVFSGPNRPGVGRFPSIVIDYEAVFAWMTTSERAAIRIDGVSTGNDLLPVDETGLMDPTREQVWVAMLFSLDDVPGRPAGGADSLAAASGRAELGGTVFGHYFEQSIGLDGDLLGQTLLEQRPGEIGLQGLQNTTGLDLGMAVLAQRDANTPGGFESAVVDRYYFTLTDATAPGFAVALASRTALAPDDLLAAEEGGTIFLSVLDANGNWGLPTVFARAQDLGTMNAEVDALAINEQRRAIVFSRDTGMIEDQLTVCAFPSAQTATTLPWPPTPLLAWDNGVVEPATTVIGLTVTDDIDALCIQDPEGEASPWLATATEVAGPNMQLSVARWRTNNGFEAEVRLDGWGAALPVASNVELYARMGGGGGGGWVAVPGSMQARPAGRSTLTWTLPLAPTIPLASTSFVELIAVNLPDGGGPPNAASWIAAMR